MAERRRHHRKIKALQQRQQRNAQQQNLPGQVASSPSPKARLRKHHTMRITKGFWKEVTGQTERSEKERKWRGGDSRIAQITRDTEIRQEQLGKHRASLSEYAKNVKIFFSTFVDIHKFNGQRRIRRLRLDAHIGRQRGIGDVMRRFYPIGMPMSKIVVFWGDGDFAPTLSNVGSTPSSLLRSALSNGWAAGRGGKEPHKMMRPEMFLPGYEYKSSKKCPECEGQVSHLRVAKRILYLCETATCPVKHIKTRLGENIPRCHHCHVAPTKFKVEKKQLYRVLRCDNVEKHNGRSKLYERNKMAPDNIIRASLSLVTNKVVPEYLQKE